MRQRALPILGAVAGGALHPRLCRHLHLTARLLVPTPVLTSLGRSPTSTLGRIAISPATTSSSLANSRRRRYYFHFCFCFCCCCCESSLGTAYCPFGSRPTPATSPACCARLALTLTLTLLLICSSPVPLRPATSSLLSIEPFLSFHCSSCRTTYAAQAISTLSRSSIRLASPSFLSNTPCHP